MLDLRGAFPRRNRRDERRLFRNVDVAQLCKVTLTEAYGDEKSVHKAIAEDTGLSTSAAENWTQGENPMSLTAFLNAYHNNPKFKAHARKLILMESELDPALEIALAEFVRIAQRQGVAE